jgi:hypothetical protein
VRDSNFDSHTFLLKHKPLKSQDCLTFCNQLKKNPEVTILKNRFGPLQVSSKETKTIKVFAPA